MRTVRLTLALSTFALIASCDSKTGNAVNDADFSEKSSALPLNGYYKKTGPEVDAALHVVGNRFVVCDWSADSPAGGKNWLGSYDSTNRVFFYDDYPGIPLSASGAIDLFAWAGSSAGTAYSGTFQKTLTWNDAATNAPSGSICVVEPELVAAPAKIDTVAIPVISPNGGIFVDSVVVKITSATPNAKILYFTDGTLPSTVMGSTYSDSIVLKANAIVRAIAVNANGTAVSSDISAAFTITPNYSGLLQPTLSPVLTDDSAGSIVGIDFAGANVGYAISNKGSLFKSIDAGNSWTKIIEDTNTYTGLEVVSDDILYVTYTNDSGAYVMKSNDGGTSWASTHLLGNIYTLRGVYFADKLHGYISCPYVNEYYTADGGETWIKGKTEDPPLGWAVFQGLTGYARLQGTATTIGAIPTIELYKTMDGGINWTALSSTSINTSDAHYSDYAFLTNAVGYLVKQQNTDNDTIFKTIDGGQTWSAVSVANMSRISDGRVYFASETNFYAVLADSVRYTTDGGKIWQAELIKKTGISASVSSYTVKFKDANNWFVGGSYKSKPAILKLTTQP